MIPEIRVGDRWIGSHRPCFIIAEAGVNHNGDSRLAMRLIDTAAEAGADAVKFQTFKADRLVSHAAPKAGYQLRTTDPAESQLDMVRRLELSPSVYRELQVYCRERRLVFLSTPFDEESVDLLDDLDVPLFKIGSGEITNRAFLGYVARKRKPMILSTGMAHLSEVEDAVGAVRAAGCDRIVLLQCVSNYPADPADINLRAMRTMAEVFGVPVGFSDHTVGIEVALAAVALGACVIEKHITLDRTMPGPDHRASAEPAELAALVRGLRTVEAALGHGRKEPAASEAHTAVAARRSLVAAQDIPSGVALTEAMIAVKRPGTGLPPGMRPSLVGRTTRAAILRGTVLTLEMLA